MKNKKSLIIIVVSLLLIGIGLALIFTGNNKSFMSKKNKPGSENSDNNKPDDSKPIIKVFTKGDVMSLIYEKKALDTSSSDDWYVGDTALLAHNSDNSKYLVRYKKVSNGKTDEYESIVTVGEGTSIELPGWSVGSRNLDEYGFIYYTEGSEGYDPINQQYNPDINTGWDPSQNTWEEYVPDNSWQKQTW